MIDLLVVSPTGVSEQLLRHAPLHQGMTAAGAAKEFETMLIAAWMKTAREAGEIDEKEDQMTGADSYLEFAEKYVAEAIAKTNVFGFAEMIGDGLDRSSGTGPKASAARPRSAAARRSWLLLWPGDMKRQRLAAFRLERHGGDNLKGLGMLADERHSEDVR